MDRGESPESFWRFRMKKIIYFYGPAEVKKHGGLEGLKNYARKNRYQLRDASLYAVEGQIEKADEFSELVKNFITRS